MFVGGLVTSPDDFRAKLEGGLQITRANGWSFRASANYDGIGADDFEAYGGQLWLEIPLN